MTAGFRTRAGLLGRDFQDRASRRGRFCAVSLVTLLALGQSACLLPVRSAPGVTGRVFAQASGEPVEGALVVVRFDGRYGDQLPDREHLGHAETRTGPDGRFTIAALLPPVGLRDASTWLSFITRVENPGSVGDGDGSPETQGDSERFTSGSVAPSRTFKAATVACAISS